MAVRGMPRWGAMSNAVVKVVAGTCALVFLLVIGQVAPAHVQAQEGAGEQLWERAGPYEIGIIEKPSSLAIGQARISIWVLNASTGQPVPDARVVVRVRHEESGTEGWALAVKTSSSQERYDALMDLDTPGTWAMSVEVDSSLGEVELEIPPLEIQAPRRFSGGTFVYIGVSFIIVLGAAYVWWSARRPQKNGIAGASNQAPDGPQ